MKKLSIEEKAKRYDETLKKAKDTLQKSSAKDVAETIVCHFFPELAESEDEKIRKEILDYIDKATGCKRWGAWLEKQGEKKVSYTTLAETGNGGINALVTKELPTNGCNEQKPFDYENATIVQKDFAPKTEPKFHKGEWLCENEPNNYARFIQILETVNVQGKERYRISRDIHNDEDIVEFDFVEKYYHKFDIQDATDGDVLSNGKMIVIFKHFEDPSYRQHIVAHIGLDTNGDIQITDDTWNLGIDKAKPATKEQRDTLMKAMADAGCEFDFEKKELKKIEQKLAWSEEDERMMMFCCDYLDDNQINWLKSLKDRIGG